MASDSKAAERLNLRKGSLDKQLDETAGHEIEIEEVNRFPHAQKSPDTLGTLHSPAGTNLLFPIKEVSLSSVSECTDWKSWFKLPAFYIYGFVYMGCRMLVNIQSVFSCI